MSEDNYTKLRAYPCAGDPFWLEINAASLRLLCRAADLTATDLAPLLKRTPESAAQLLKDGSRITLAETEQIGLLWGLRPLRAVPPVPELPLCEFTVRSLVLLRAANDLSQYDLARISGVSRDYIKELELGKKTEVGRKPLRLLGQALGVRFFLT